MTDPGEQNELNIEKQPLEGADDDLPLEESEAEDIQGGFAPPYSPVGPVVQG